METDHCYALWKIKRELKFNKNLYLFRLIKNSLSMLWKKYPFLIPVDAKRDPFPIAVAWKKYPFRAEHPRIVQYREYPPRDGIWLVEFYLWVSYGIWFVEFCLLSQLSYLGVELYSYLTVEFYLLSQLLYLTVEFYLFSQLLYLGVEFYLLSQLS